MYIIDTLYIYIYTISDSTPPLIIINPQGSFSLTQLFSVAEIWDIEIIWIQKRGYGG